MSDATPAVGATITVGDFELSSNTETAEQMREAVKTVRPIKERKPGDRISDRGRIDTTHVDAGGKSHDAEGRFKGAEGKEKPAEKETETPEAKEAKAKEREVERIRKEDASSRVRDAVAKKNAAEERAEKERLRAERAERARDEAEAKLRAPKPAEPEGVTEAEKRVQGLHKLNAAVKAQPKLADFGPVDEVETWTKFNEANSAWLLEEAERRVEERNAKRDVEERKSRQAAELSEREERQAEEHRKAAAAGDEAIKARGGAAFLETVKDVSAKLVPRFMLPDGQPVTAMTGLADYVLLHGEKIPDVLEYLRDNPEHIQAFEEIVRAPPERQPLLFERELGILYASLRAALKASATAGTPEPRALPEPRAKTPVRPVAGSPNAVEADLSNVADLDEYIQKLPAERRAQIMRRR